MDATIPHMATVDGVERYLDAATINEIHANNLQACRDLHERCVGLARRRGEIDADEAEAINEANELQIWREYALPNLSAYLEHVFGYTPRVAEERERVARELVELPHLRAGLTAGLPWAKVRELTRVATGNTEIAWLDATRALNCRQIESMVRGRKKGDLPTDPANPQLAERPVFLKLTPAAYAQLRVCGAALSDECGERLDDSQLVLAMVQRALETIPGNSPAGRPHAQVAYVVCSECGGATADGAGIVVDVAPVMMDRAMCDAEDLGDLDSDAPARVTSAVTPRTRRQVFARDRHRCSVPTCRASRGLQIHHLRHQEHGGGHHPSNLVCLCISHHDLHHQGKIEIGGSAPRLTFRRIVDGGDRVEELGDYEMVDVWTAEDAEPPRE
jgi:hypothetical protein